MFVCRAFSSLHMCRIRPPRQIKAFILGFVKSTNQCLFSPFVLICEWDTIPNFADMRLGGETRRNHLCRIETTENYGKDLDFVPWKSFPMHDLLPRPKNANCGFSISVVWAAPHMFWTVNASFIRSRKMNMIRGESATALSWTHALFNFTQNYIVVKRLFRFSLLPGIDLHRWVVLMIPIEWKK